MGGALRLAWLLLLLRAGAGAGAGWPARFSAEVVREAGRVDPALEYPPVRTLLGVRFDAAAGRARVDFRASGEVWIKRYDAGWEARLHPSGGCSWGRLEGGAGAMPAPGWPEGAERVGDVFLTDEQLKCEKWRDGEGGTGGAVAWVYLTRDTPTLPVKVRVETEGLPGSQQCSPEPDMAYTMSEFLPGEPDAAAFELPPGLDPARCSPLLRGLPLEHVWHHYIRI